HQVPTLIGVKQNDLVSKISNLVPDYMAMGETGMAEMSEMASMMDMPLPENTLPMMTGTGQFGAINMGGMFTTVKVRDGLARDDYKDPGPYKHPKGTVAYEYTGEAPAVQRQPASEEKSAVEVQVRKPTGHTGH
ncbi:MAG: copper oxidase, partial [Methylotenera sp.]